MVVKVYVSGISGNKEVKKRQQRVIMILDSKNMLYNVVDITEPGKENEKAFMQANSKTKDESKTALPPQIFNGDVYCGDYDDFDLANEMDELYKFLKVPTRKELAKKSPPKEQNGSNTANIINIEETEEGTSASGDTNKEVLKEKKTEEQPGPSTSDDEDSSDSESLDTQNKMNDTTKSPNSVPLPDDTNVLLDVPDTKQESLLETEQAIEE